MCRCYRPEPTLGFCQPHKGGGAAKALSTARPVENFVLKNLDHKMEEEMFEKCFIQHTPFLQHVYLGVQLGLRTRTAPLCIKLAVSKEARGRFRHRAKEQIQRVRTFCGSSFLGAIVALCVHPLMVCSVIPIA